MWPVPSGQQEVHEYEALGGGFGKRRHIRFMICIL